MGQKARAVPLLTPCHAEFPTPSDGSCAARATAVAGQDETAKPSSSCFRFRGPKAFTVGPSRQKLTKLPLLVSAAGGEESRTPRETATLMRLWAGCVSDLERCVCNARRQPPPNTRSGWPGVHPTSAYDACIAAAGRPGRRATSGARSNAAARVLSRHPGSCRSAVLFGQLCVACGL